MNSYGFRGNCNHLIKNYLTDRMQAVRINNSMSDYKTIECGIPQGSVLGPLLFLIYLNDLNSISLNLEVITFADDASIFMSNSDTEILESKMNEELAAIFTWFECNKLKLNTQKTGFQFFTKNKNVTEPCLEINGTVIKKVEEVKFLGLLVDSKLTFKAHIHKLGTKMSQLAGVIGNAKHFLNQSQLMLLYNSLLVPHLTYCSLIWGINYSTNLSRLLLLQKRIARHILGLKHSESVTHRFGEIQMLTIYSLIKYRAVLFAHKHLNHRIPASLSSILEIRDPVVETRSSSKFKIPFSRLNYRSHTVRFLYQ